jgi:hypothetical protein
VPHVLFGNQDIDCAGCRARISPKPEPSCVNEIRLEGVIDAVTRLAAVSTAGTAA